MSEEEIVDTHRKSKLSSAGKRDFGCPCGKTYLSYPALFTHVKQKHNGKVFCPLFLASWRSHQAQNGEGEG